ncbi:MULTISPECIES: curli-like amyloid fiber formation chaperone CsgH [Rhizobium]|uniref:Curli-like amyloid fiber formation chaperone CsgH n=1 Tax=Rhizobium rhododendri TaxID=2506430 RepID=A0ABY8IP15_9HYPH|nr:MULTISPECIES: curli-like amyloid fiber formation chaperone CsgH [Rhizobium]MBZ5761910.1 hypothetical protein [Rhizobium sp. VS19-DR96]MBZ5767896.1 hypothetical protein [Rhizobium sp. VS19-DR129.2]MBZ5775244.1 hypothetical protein [Rhizobium sp. VS19-DRK62.2]MBZ5786789.1 hypothetical protein [Rhizobium sp. VS19-DR121]MBZ5803945.1 hypothetical protein [Rhizobium sp. VS19-DR181]
MPNSVEYPRRLMTILALALLPVTAVAAMMTAGQPDAAQLCRIEVSPGAGVVKLDARVDVDKHVSGTYTFRVEKTGNGGISTTNQSGDFDATVGHPTILSSVSLETGGIKYKATLDVLIGDKSFSCSKQIPGS